MALLLALPQLLLVVPVLLVPLLTLLVEWLPEVALLPVGLFSLVLL